VYVSTSMRSRAFLIFLISLLSLSLMGDNIKYFIKNLGEWPKQLR
jgi:hypothetical protein